MSDITATCPRCEEELTFGQLGVVSCPHCFELSEVVGHWPKVIIRPWPGKYPDGSRGPYEIEQAEEATARKRG